MSVNVHHYNLNLKRTCISGQYVQFVDFYIMDSSLLEFITNVQLSTYKEHIVMFKLPIIICFISKEIQCTPTSDMALKQ